jgi:type VI secretion system protein ImpJ
MLVHWHEGLFLQPHHLQLMQRRLLSDIRAARGLFNPYCFGVLESRLSPDELADGRIRFERLRAILPSGQEVFFPEDANLPPLDIKAELTRGSGALELVLAAPLWAKTRANAFRLGTSADPRVKLLYIPEEARDVSDENSGDNPQAVHIRKVNARVILKSDDLSDMEFIPLLRVLRSVGETLAQQDREFVPPSLLLRSSPVLHDLARDLVAQLHANRDQHRLKVAGGGLGMEAKWELTMRLTVLNRFCGSLPSLIEEGMVPPFTVYLQLRELLGELLALHPGETLFECRPYNHLDPLPAFKELDQKIRGEFKPIGGDRVWKEPFVPDGARRDCMRVDLKPEYLEKPTGYFLGVKTKIERTRLSLYVTDANKFKLMPRTLENAAIFGVELKEENFPPFELERANDLHYFRVVADPASRRWGQVKNDKALSVVWNNTELDLSDAAITLYMTLPT